MNVPLPRLHTASLNISTGLKEHITYNRETSLRGVCAQNLQTRGLKNGNDVALVPIFCAGLVSIHQEYQRK